MSSTVLADTSVWIPFFNGEESEEIDRFQEMIVEDQICICPPVIQEILQGISSDRDYKKLINRINGLILLECKHYEAATGAANIYRDLRKKGITIRKSNDCLIAWYALHFNKEVWCRDRDFHQIALHFPLQIFHFK